MDKEAIKTKYKLLIDTTKGKILLLESRKEKNLINEADFKKELRKLKNKVSEYQWKLDRL